MTARRRPWLLLACSAVVVLLIGAAAIAGWYHSDRDLRLADDEARAMGLPLTWSDWGIVVAPPERLQCWQDIVTHSRGLKSWQSARDLTVRWPRMEPGVTPPPEMVAHHAGQDMADVQALLDALDHLGADVLHLQASIGFTDARPEFLPRRDVTRLLAERVMLASLDALPLEARRLAAFTASDPGHLMIGHLVRTANAEVAAQAFACRLADLRRLSQSECAAFVDRLADDLDAGYEQALIGEWLSQRAILPNPQAIDQLRSVDFPGTSVAMGPFAGVVVRAGRLESARLTQAQIVASRIRDHRARRLLLQSLISSVEARHPWNPRYALARLLTSAAGMIDEKTRQTVLHLRVLAAELRGAPWPEDSFAPAGTPLRRLEQDGILIGAYSVWRNGIDDGGDEQQDRRFLLFAPPAAAKAPDVP